MDSFDIQVSYKGEWRHRTTVNARSANAALKAYGISGSRPYLGEATSRSGKRFRAIPEVTP